LLHPASHDPVQSLALVQGWAQVLLRRQVRPEGQLQATNWPQLLFLVVPQAAPAQVVAAGSGTQCGNPGCGFFFLRRFLRRFLATT
jgi:hypothetical protein